MRWPVLFFGLVIAILAQRSEADQVLQKAVTFRSHRGTQKGFLASTQELERFEVLEIAVDRFGEEPSLILPGEPAEATRATGP